MRAALVVFDPPGLDQPLRLGDRFEPVDVQAFVVQRPIEGLDKGVIGRLSGARKIYPCSMVVGPQINKLTCELGAIVSKQIFGGHTTAHETIEYVDDVLATQPMPHFDRKAFPTEHIDSGQCAELLAVAQLVMDEIQAPRLVRPLGAAAGFTMNDHLPATRPLCTQREAFFAIKTIDNVAHGHWKTTTFVGALTLRGFIAPFVLDGPINRDAFETYVEKVLCPQLRPADVVIMDNLSSHKGPCVREMIEAAGGRLLYLPPYSLDFNPIEKAFSKLKALLRKAAERKLEGLWTKIGGLIQLVTPDECRNYFTAAGYDPE